MRPGMYSLLASIVLTSLVGLATQAAVIVPGDSTGFDYKYEMDAAPSSSDLDGNSSDDFFAGTSTIPGDVLSNASYTGGIATIKDNNTNTGSSVFRTDTGTSVWRTNFLSDTTWMAEVRLQVNDDSSFPEGSGGSLLISGGIAGVSPILKISQDKIEFSSSSGGYTTYMDGTDFTAAYYTFTIGRDADGEGWLWVDDNLLAQDQPSITGLGGGHANGFFVGGESFSGSINGAYEADYIRLNTDFETQVIPEPASGILALLALGMFALIRKKQ